MYVPLVLPRERGAVLYVDGWVLGGKGRNGRSTIVGRRGEAKRRGEKRRGAYMSLLFCGGREVDEAN